MKIALITFAVLAVVELMSLAWLASTVSTYRRYWLRKAQQPGEFTYVALGDSAAQGVGATSPMRGYVGLLSKRIQAKTGKTVRIVNLSVSGATVADCLAKQIPQLKDIKPDLVTIECGANDVKRGRPDEFRKQFAELLTHLPAGTYVSNMPLFNSRPGSTQTAKEHSDIIAGELAKYPDLTLVDLQKQTSEHQSIFGFAPDGFHPNNLSYKNWDQAFWDQIEKDL